MAIIKTVVRENPYVMIDKTGVQDCRISWKATGLLTYLVGRPSDWNISVSHLATVKKDGEKATIEALKELREFGYCHLFRIKERGRNKQSVYIVFEVPTKYEKAAELIDLENGESLEYQPAKSKVNKSVSPQPENPLVEIPLVENRGLINKEYTNDRINKKNKHVSDLKSVEEKDLGKNPKGYNRKDKWEKFINENLIGIDYIPEIEKAIKKLEKTTPEAQIQSYLIAVYAEGKRQGLSNSILVTNYITKDLRVKEINKKNKHVSDLKSVEEKEVASEEDPSNDKLSVVKANAINTITNLGFKGMDRIRQFGIIAGLKTVEEVNSFIESLICIKKSVQ